MVSTPGSQGQRGAETTAHVVGPEAAVIVGVEGGEHRIAAQPLFAGDAAVTIEVIQQKDLMGGMVESGATL
jgi:hypothetical protein